MPSEVVELLSVAAAFDQRTVGEFDVGAWHAAIGDLDLEDARLAVIGHYREHRERLMPADVRDRVILLRRERLAAVPDLPPDVDPDDPGYFAALRARREAIASGVPVEHLRTLNERPAP